MRKPGQIGPDNLQGKFITGSYLKVHVGCASRAISSGRCAARPRTRAPGVNTACSPGGANQFRCAAVLRGNTPRPAICAAQFSRRRCPHARSTAPTPARPRPPARSRTYPRFGALQGTKGNAERSAAIPGASQFIFGYLALLTELSRVCEGAPPNVVLHNFDVTPLTILGIASPLNL